MSIHTQTLHFDMIKVLFVKLAQRLSFFTVYVAPHGSREQLQKQYMGEIKSLLIAMYAVDARIGFIFIVYKLAA